MSSSEKAYDDQILQYRQPGTNGTCDLIIGLDFGTSATKVVIQVPDLPGSPSYAVDFSNYSQTQMLHLLPTKLWIKDDGSCSLLHRDNRTQVNDLKLNLLSDNRILTSDKYFIDRNIYSEEQAACYLALVLRETRRWFLKAHRDIIGHFNELKWSVNLGVPSRCAEKNEENERFWRVGQAACLLSMLPVDNITLNNARRELEQVADQEYWEDYDDPEFDFHIIPEIAAGAVGYAKSDLFKMGLHVIIDIGASTIDVCGFVLRNDEIKRYSLLTADVEQLGTLRLHHKRIHAICCAYKEELIYKHDPLSPINEELEQYIFDDEFIRSKIHEAEDILEKHFMGVVFGAILDLKMKRAPKEDVFVKKLPIPIILIGGGSKSSFFQELAKSFSYHLNRRALWDKGVKLLQIHAPDTLNARTKEYHRLVVAWGLSHRDLDIGEIVPSDRIPDMDPPRRRDWQSGYIGKDQV